MAGERTARVWAWIAAAREGDAPVSLAALCRAAANWLAVDGASVTAVSGLGVREPLSATDNNRQGQHQAGRGEDQGCLRALTKGGVAQQAPQGRACRATRARLRRIAHRRVLGVVLREKLARLAAGPDPALLRCRKALLCSAWTRVG